MIQQWTGPVTNPVWMVALGNGLSSMAVSGGRAFTQVCRTNEGIGQEVCLALSTTNGAELWATPVDIASYPSDSVGYDDGPRTTPTVHSGSVFVLTSYMKLLRLNAVNGSIIWSNDLRALYGGDVIEWQNAASPVLDGELIFVNANASPSRLMAFHAADGSLAWRSQDEAMTHSSPIVATIQSVRQLVFACQSGLVSIDPASGRLLWKSPYPLNYATSLGVSPVVYQNYVFITIGRYYGRWAVGVQVTNTGSGWTAAQLWLNTTSFSTCSTWMTPVCYEGYLYGQFDDNRLNCVDLRTGAVVWSSPATFGRGGTILVASNLVSITENGQLVLVKAVTNAYTELGRCLAIPNYSGAYNKCWHAPAICDGQVYVRSTAYAACFDFSIPDLKLDLPRWIAPGQLQLTARTVTGAPIALNRVSSLEFLSTTDLAQLQPTWTKLTDSPIYTNGVVQIGTMDAGHGERYFMVREPN